MKFMCNISQFVISSPPANYLCTPRSIIMSNVILAFGMGLVVVIDDGSSFKIVFTSMCTSLNITYWCLSRDNHTSNYMETIIQDQMTSNYFFSVDFPP